MPIRFDTLKTAIKHTLGGDPAAGASYARIINGAGRAWTAAQEWYYLANRTATLTATVGSEWVALPADYQAFVNLVPDGDGYATLALVQPAEFIEIAEAGTLGNVASYIATIQYRDVSGDVEPWLRLYPTPSIADTFTLVYDAQWGDVNDDEDEIPVPKFAEHAFEEWVRMYARGMDEEDAASLADRMAALKASPLFLDVARRDALVTGAVVSPGRGAAQAGYGAYVRWNHPNNLS
jgi:hypothetical protein